jgi:acyl carrier protein/malonyl CoA-acyl carrier protein transacylase
VYSNSTGAAYSTDSSEIKKILAQHILNSVDFKTEIENMYAAGARVFVEFGPKSILTNLVKDILADKEHFVIATNAKAAKNSDLQIREAAIQLQVLGCQLGAIDNNARKEATPLAQPKMAVKIAGNNYVSPATQKAYKEVLNNGFRVSAATAVIKTEEDIKEIEVISEVINAVPTYTNEDSTEQETEEDMMVDVIKSAIDGIKENQSKTLDMFQTILMEQNKQTAQLLGLLSGNFAPDRNILEAPAAPLSIENPSPVAHSAPIAAPVTRTDTDIKPVAKQVLETAVPASDNSEMLNLMLSVVADKTGYPAEMLELSMDMEADLGIDSIKRVEIFGAITEQSDKLTDINPTDLTELRTLQEIVDYISSKAGISATTAPVAKPVPQVKTTKATVVTVAATSGNSEMLDLMLSVVADKTGYPAEMLELSMDMESDLGIDSIKRVEIFGAITEQSDKLTDINPTDLTELRTLQEIVDYISSKAGISASAETQSIQSTPKVEEVSVPETVAIVQKTTISEGNSEMLDLMLSVVADKTGYPAEMLELSMDMEADLGIDSIKRVEIFGAITEQSDKLTDINPTDLTELRTLQEIVDYISSKAGISSKKKSLSLA